MTEHQPPRRRWPGRYDKPFLIRLEISHADDTTPTLLAALQSLLRLEAHRTGELPTSDVTCLLWQTSPQHAIDDLKDQLYGLIDQRLDPTAHGQAVEQIVRSGWASVDDILDLGHLEPAWNWDTIDHDCTQNRKRLVYGMYLPTPADDPDEIAIVGCQPGTATGQCRICGAEW